MKELSEMGLEELWQLFPIVLKGHCVEYAVWYEEKKTALPALLENYVVRRINHICSASVVEAAIALYLGACLLFSMALCRGLFGF